jgi:hypothetical protein
MRASSLLRMQTDRGDDVSVRGRSCHTSRSARTPIWTGDQRFDVSRTTMRRLNMTRLTRRLSDPSAMAQGIPGIEPPLDLGTPCPVHHAKRSHRDAIPPNSVGGYHLSDDAPARRCLPTTPDSAQGRAKAASPVNRVTSAASPMIFTAVDSPQPGIVACMRLAPFSLAYLRPVPVRNAPVKSTRASFNPSIAHQHYCSSEPYLS